MKRVHTSAESREDPRVIDVSGITNGIGRPFAPDLRYERWLTGMKAELLKKEAGKGKKAFEDLLAVMAESRYRQHLALILRDNPLLLKPVLEMEVAILVCPCSVARLCHRRFLAKVLTEAHGVLDMGEVPIAAEVIR